MEENKQNQGNDSGKVEKQYEQAKQSLLAILGEGGMVLLKRDKATNDQIDKAVASLLKKKDEEFAIKVETDINKLIEIYLEAEEAIVKKEQEVKRAKTDSKKKFTEEANKILNRVTDHMVLRERIKKALGKVAGVEEQSSASETAAGDNDLDAPNYSNDQTPPEE